MTERWILIGNLLGIALFDLSLVPLRRGDFSKPPKIPHRWASSMNCRSCTFPQAHIIGNYVHQILPQVTDGICCLVLNISSKASSPYLSFFNLEERDIYCSVSSYSNGTFLYFDRQFKGRFVHVFSTVLRAIGDFPQIWSVGVPWMNPKELVAVAHDTHSSRLLLHCTGGRSHVYHLERAAIGV